ncbi:hypothetical protein EX30DRAFT_67510 [Ascodesmis nigricans]|uniref:Transmembrane protein n=1 Tax=Ascodesmis nigricans TaxID=341454 RepID=A0A4S2MU59_9PEZI|nr:hypothetical protein EX30DRAFT_67510 [Ascodesmis nigricans]
MLDAGFVAAVAAVGDTLVGLVMSAFFFFFSFAFFHLGFFLPSCSFMVFAAICSLVLFFFRLFGYYGYSGCIPYYFSREYSTVHTRDEVYGSGFWDSGFWDSGVGWHGDGMGWNGMMDETSRRKPTRQETKEI